MKKSEIRKAILADLEALTNDDDAVVTFNYSVELKEFMQAVGDLWLYSHNPQKQEMLKRAANIVMDALQVA